MQGTVKFFNIRKGYGFIVADEPGLGDVLVHASDLAGGYRDQDRMMAGTRVEFDPRDTERGRRALRVTLLPGATVMVLPGGLGVACCDEGTGEVVVRATKADADAWLAERGMRARWLGDGQR